MLTCTFFDHHATRLIRRHHDVLSSFPMSFTFDSFDKQHLSTVRSASIFTSRYSGQ